MRKDAGTKNHQSRLLLTYDQERFGSYIKKPVTSARGSKES
jgi:hypothetical protein